MTDEFPRILCQRCGQAMTLKDPEPGGAWKPDQYWVCPACGRHFWSTYPAPASKDKEKGASPAAS